MKKILLILFAALLILSGCGASTAPTNDVETDEQPPLTEKYPTLFDLDASNGLDVIVQELAKDHFSFGLLPHPDVERDWLSPELMFASGVNAEEMRAILATYDIDEDLVYIVPYQSPISSYIGDYWISTDDENIEEKQAAYIAKIREMLFA